MGVHAHFGIFAHERISRENTRDIFLRFHATFSYFPGNTAACILLLGLYA